jgi:hypothetical protein
LGGAFALATLLTPLAGQDRESDVQALAQRASAKSDDWISEQLHEQAKAQLHELGLLVQEDPQLAETELAGLFDAGFVPHALRIAELESVATGFVDCGRASAAALAAENVEPETGAREVLARLFGPLGTASERRVDFKIVSVDAQTDAGFETDVLVQGSGSNLQLNSRWAISWVSGEEDGAALIREIRALSLTECRSRGPMFAERTRTLLGKAGGRTSLLAAGCGEWRGRVDALGEPNFFGHNGIAIGDVNGDGLEDLYVAMGTGIPNLLFLQQADGSVIERGAEAGVAWSDDTKGVLLIDYDNDGDRDLLCALGPAIVALANDGRGDFTVRHSLKAATGAAFYSLAAADYDLDGNLDVYATRYVKTSYGDSVPRPFHDARNGPTNLLLRLDGDKGFSNVTDAVGLGAGNDRFSLAAAWIDYDADGDPDLYVANDFGRNNLYRNDGGRFVDVAAQSGTEDQAAGMGVSWADADLDGDYDLLVSNMFSSAGQRIAYQPRFKTGADALRSEIQHHSLGNSLFLNDGEGGFEDGSDAAGLRMGRWAWGARFTDFDGDGRPDVVVPNGFLTNAKSDDL